MTLKLCNCARCGRSFELGSVGRPRQYCCKSCYRLQGYEVRRVARRLETLENRASHLRYEADYMPRVGRQAQLEAVQAQIVEVEERLMALFAAGT